MTGNIHSFLSDMIGAAKSKSGDAMLVFNLDQVLKGLKPGKAEVLRRCAIPRWFDSAVLRVLREQEDGNERIIEQMREFSFIRDLGDGRMAYHDQVRRILLAEWAESRPDELAQIHRRLYSYFTNRMTPPGSTRRAVQLVPESTMLSVVPMSVQADMFRREAIYHRINADPARGMDELRVVFTELESAHRLAEAELLLQVADEVPLDLPQQRWLQYLRARTHMGGLNLDLAMRQLETMRALPDLDPDLDAETSRTLAQIYSETGQWARATQLFTQSLKYFQSTGNQQAMANTMLLLGEAYQGLGISTGSWHVSHVAEHNLLRVAQNAWIWLIGLPFQIAVLLMSRLKQWLPLPTYCARYQNWLLIRLYNAARSWYAQAYDEFRRLGDESGMLRAEHRLIDIQRLYGYHEEAWARVENLLKLTPSRDPYVRAWLERTLAECHLDAGNIGSAQLLLAHALVVFREFGDVRREAAILMLQSHAAMQAGDSDSALSGFASSLERYRNLGYAAARERILHELRAWKHRPDISATLRQRIADLIAAEPEKRYVGRFIRSYLSLLQIVSMFALPVALLLLAVAVPTTNISSIAGGILSATTFYDPLRIAMVMATVSVCYVGAYATLALVVIYGLTITRVEREQPDVIITRPGTIARYNHMGNLALEVPWAEVRRWLALDRCLWDRPMPLYSRAFLEDSSGRDLVIEGITGWYGDVQIDIEHRLAVAGSTVQRDNMGYHLLKSKSGIAIITDLVLLLLVTMFENQWLQLPIWFPTWLYALISFLTMSGTLLLVPLAYWLVSRPLRLQRTLLLNENWPDLLMLIGALPVLLYIVGGGKALSINGLNYSTFIWGVYVFSEALVARFLATRNSLRLPLVTIATLLALLIVARPVYASYRWQVSYTAKGQVADAVAVGAAPTSTNATNCTAGAADALALGSDPFSTYMIQGDCAAIAEDWEKSSAYYQDAVTIAAPGSDEQVLALYNLWNTTRRFDRKRAALIRLQIDQMCAASLRARPICIQIITHLDESTH